MLVSGCIAGPVTFGGIQFGGASSTPTETASPAPASTASPPAVEKRVTFTPWYVLGKSNPLTEGSNTFIMSWTLDGHGDEREVTVYRSGTALNERQKYRARLQMNGKDIATVEDIRVDKDRIVFKMADGKPLIHVGGPTLMTLRLDGKFAPGEWKQWEPFPAIRATAIFTIASGSFVPGDGTTMADFSPFEAEYVAF